MGVINKGDCGQMTIELAVAMPVMVIVAVIAVNALTFFGQCAVFDRVAHEAARVHAAAPSYGQEVGQSCALIEQDVREAVDAPNVDVAVTWEGVGADHDKFTATLEYHPTLFGLGLRSEVFGISLPPLSHSTVYVIDAYKPGVVV